MIPWARGDVYAYKWNGNWYKYYDTFDEKYEGEIVDPILYTTDNALRDYRSNIVIGGIWCIIIMIFLFVFRNYISVAILSVQRM